MGKLVREWPTESQKPQQAEPETGVEEKHQNGKWLSYGEGKSAAGRLELQGITHSVG